MKSKACSATHRSSRTGSWMVPFLSTGLTIICGKESPTVVMRLNGCLGWNFGYDRSQRTKKQAKTNVDETDLPVTSRFQAPFEGLGPPDGSKRSVPRELRGNARREGSKYVVA